MTDDDLSEEDILVTMMLEYPALLDEMRAQHSPSGRTGPRGVRHCRACPGAIRGRPVWPCGIRQAADRAETLRRLRAKAAQGRARLEREAGPLEIDDRDTNSGPPRPPQRH